MLLWDSIDNNYTWLHNNSGQAHAISLDLSKAFDTVLSSYGIHGQLLNWINTFFNW